MFVSIELISQGLASDFGAMMMSSEAIQLYISFGSAMIFVGALWIAWAQIRYLHELNLVREMELRIPGPLPIKVEAIERRRDRVEAFRQNKWRTVWRRVWLLLTAGVAVPTVGLCLVAFYSDALLPGSVIFEDRSSGALVSHASHIDLVLFVLSEMSKGALLDVIEVFQCEFGGVTNNSANVFFGMLLVGYRAIVGVTASTFVAFLLLATRFELKTIVVSSDLEARDDEGAVFEGPTSPDANEPKAAGNTVERLISKMRNTNNNTIDL